MDKQTNKNGSLHNLLGRENENNRHQSELIPNIISTTPYKYNWTSIYTVWVGKNCANITVAITLSILNRFVNFFTAAKSDKFPTKSILVYPPHRKYVAAFTVGNLKPFARTHSWRHYQHCKSSLQLTSGKKLKSISRHVSCKWWTFWTHFVNKFMQAICIFTRFWFKWHLHMVILDLSKAISHKRYKIDV